MKYVAYMVVGVSLGFMACEVSPLPAPDGGTVPLPSMDAAPMMGGSDGTLPMGGETPIGGMMPIGGALPMGGEGGSGGDGGEPMGGDGAGGDAAGGSPDFGGLPGPGGAMEMPGVPQCEVPGRTDDDPTTVPDYGEATAVFDGVDIHFFWFEKSENGVDDSTADGEPGVYQCTLGSDGLFRGPAEPVRHLDGRADELSGQQAVGVVSARVRGMPWVAYGGETLPIRVFQAHRPTDTLMVLDGAEGRPHLVGAPHVVAAGRELMVFGRTPVVDGEPGHPAWVRVTADLEIPDAVVDLPLVPLPAFDEIVPVRGGLLARAGNEGQCVFIQDDDWQPISNFYCRFGVGGLLSDGEDPLLWSRFDFRQNGVPVSRVGIWPTYTFRDDIATFYSVVNFEDETLLRYPAYNGLRPIIGERLHELEGAQSNARQTELSLIGIDEWWSSDVAVPWSNMAEGRSSGWPYTRTRALATRYPPADGCPAEQGCVADTLNAVVFSHGNRGPQLAYIPLLERIDEEGLYGQPPAGQCAPSPETCDGVDNDCDGLIDDGLCCLGETVAQFDFPEDVNRPPNRNLGPVTQWLVNPSWQGADYWILYRHEGAGEEDDTASWDGFKWQIGNGTSQNFGARDGLGRLPFAHLGAGESLHPAGGKSAVLIRDDDGVLYLTWSHDSALLKAPLRIPDACQDYLAVGVLRSDGNRESIFLVCRDRMVRYYGHPAWPDLTYYWAEECPGGCDAQSQALGLDSGVREIRWATLTQSPQADPIGRGTNITWDTQFSLVVGYEFDFVPQIKVYNIGYTQDRICDTEWTSPCISHCGAQDESVYCGTNAETLYNPDMPPPFIDAFGDEAEGREGVWRGCGDQAVAAKNTCCEALVDRGIDDPDNELDEEDRPDVGERDDLIHACRTSIAAAVPDLWIRRMPEPTRSSFTAGWNGCFKDMAAAKGNCCVLSDEAAQTCHAPTVHPIISQDLLLTGASADPDNNYSHPLWVSPYPPELDQAHAIRSVPQGDDVGPRVELAFEGFRDEEGNVRVEWRNVSYGPTPDHLHLSPLSGRVIASRRDQGWTRFRMLDTVGDDGKYNLWAMNPTYAVNAEMYTATEPGGAGQPTWAFVEGPSGTDRTSRGPADNTFVEFHPLYRMTGDPVQVDGLAEGELTIAGVPVRAPTLEDDRVSPRPPGEGVASAIAVAAVINEMADETGVEARPNTTRVEGAPIGGGPVGEGPFRINGIDIEVLEATGRNDNDVNADDTDNRLLNAVNRQTLLTGVTATKVRADGDGEPPYTLVLTANDGRNILIEADPGLAVVVGLMPGLTYSGVTLESRSGAFEVGGEAPSAAGLRQGAATVDRTRWRITARNVECGGR